MQYVIISLLFIGIIAFTVFNIVGIVKDIKEKKARNKNRNEEKAE